MADLAWMLIALVAGGGYPAAGMIPFSQPLTAHGYKCLGFDQGVTVYRLPDAPVITLAAEGTFAAPPEKVRKVLLDYPSHTRMVEQVTESRILERGPGWLLVYQRLTLPVISDRDQVLLVEWGDFGDVLWLQFRAVSDRDTEECDEAVRLTQHSGSWQLKPLAGGRFTEARYQVAIDLGGMVPQWMVGSGTTDKIPELFQSIRRRLSAER